MALADYYLCDVCESKCFYDANLNWEMDDETGVMYLDHMGEMVAICKNCARDYEVVIRKRNDD